MPYLDGQSRCSGFVFTNPEQRSLINNWIKASKLIYSATCPGIYVLCIVERLLRETILRRDVHQEPEPRPESRRQEAAKDALFLVGIPSLRWGMEP